MKKLLAIIFISIFSLFCACDVFSDTPLPETPTATATEKIEETLTPSPEVIITPQPTVITTASPIVTETPKPMPTLMATVAPTSTPSVTPTATPNPTPTKEAVVTPIPTKKITPSPTAVVTQKPTPTATPTIKPTIKPTAQPTPTPTKNPDIVTNAMLKEIEAGFLNLVNYERSRVGVGKLTTNAHLDSCASVRAKEIITSFSHTRPNGSDCFSLIDSEKYPYVTVGENICMTSHVGDGYVTEFTGSDSQIEAVYSYMFVLFKKSPGHYANMINGDFEHCGIGISYRMESGIPMFYCAHLFGADN